MRCLVYKQIVLLQLVRKYKKKMQKACLPVLPHFINLVHIGYRPPFRKLIFLLSLFFSLFISFFLKPHDHVLPACFRSDQPKLQKCFILKVMLPWIKRRQGGVRKKITNRNFFPCFVSNRFSMQWCLMKENCGTW